MVEANAECYRERHINSSYLCDNDFVKSFNTPLLLFFNFPHSIKRIREANAECYIEKDIKLLLFIKDNCEFYYYIINVK